MFQYMTLKELRFGGNHKGKIIRCVTVGNGFVPYIKNVLFVK